jgi:iron-regulated transporter 1
MPRHPAIPGSPQSVPSHSSCGYYVSGFLNSRIQSMSTSLSFYVHHEVFLPSIALSLLYFTVLSFSGQMVTYLVAVGYSSAQIGLIRTLSVLFEMSATWIAPFVASKIGPIRAGLWFINWQITWILGSVILFLHVPSSVLAASCLTGGVILSRVGLWGFDLCAQIIIQKVRELFPGLPPSLSKSDF